MKSTRTALGSALRKCQPLLALFLALLCACTTPYLIPASAGAGERQWIVGRERYGGPPVRIEARCIDWRSQRFPPAAMNVVQVRNSTGKVVAGTLLAAVGLTSLTMGLLLLTREHGSPTASAIGGYDLVVGFGYTLPAINLLNSGLSDHCWTPEPLPLPLAASATASAG